MMSLLANVLLVLISWYFLKHTGQAQMCSRNLRNKDAEYTQCDSTTQVCECTQSVCYFCFEIEHRHTFTRYNLTKDEIQVPGYGGRVWVPNIDTGQLEEFPREAQDLPMSNEEPCDDISCTKAYVADGYSFRPILTINNVFPGPTLIVPYRAIVAVDVYNNLTSEATSIHWHGMHQMNTPWMDGVEHITQCGIAPSSSFRYIFRAFPPGTHWYHSHSGAQRTDGLFGALIVREDNKPNIPDVEDYVDEPDKYTITLLDWQKKSSLDLFVQIHAGIRFFDSEEVPSIDSDPRRTRTCSPDGTEVGPVPYWSGLINGQGKHPEVDYNMTNLTIFSVQPSSWYRFRIIGAQSLFAYRFSIDEHRLSLIATDGHLLQPETVDFIIIHSGERYDFLLETKSAQEISDNGNFIIRAETLEVEGSNPIDCAIDNNNNPLKRNLDANHSAEAILHYGSDSDIPVNTEYERIAEDSIPKYKACAESKDCVAVNCPFERFPDEYGITQCIPIHELNLLNEVTDESDLPDFENAQTEFFNFGFEGDGSTSTVNGRNFAFPSVPLQLDRRSQSDMPNICKLGDENLDNGRDKCDAPNRLFTPDCLCTHVVNIEQGQSYRFVFTAVGPDRSNNRNWNFAHPVHLHGHSFHVAKIGFGTYSDSTGKIQSATEDIKCEYNDVSNANICTNPQWSSENFDPGKTYGRAPLKDTVLIPAGGYAVVYFKANNPGYWFLHCHIEVHQLEGMSVVINEARQSHNAPPQNFPECKDFTWEIEEFEQKESMQNPSLVLGLVGGLIVLATCFFSIFILCLLVYHCVKEKNAKKYSTSTDNNYIPMT